LTDLAASLFFRMHENTLLFDAIERYYLLMCSDDPCGRRAFLELERWFESPDRVHPDSFERLCARHDLNPAAIRQMLRQRRRSARSA